jgi:hypothetical protein
MVLTFGRDDDTLASNGGRFALSSTGQIYRGVVDGKSILLDAETGLPQGEVVTVVVRVVHAAGDGIRASAGSWEDGGQELTDWLHDVQASRSADHRRLP